MPSQKSRASLLNSCFQQCSSDTQFAHFLGALTKAFQDIRAAKNWNKAKTHERNLCPNYYTSPHLKNIYDLLYPRLNFKNILTISHSEITEPFHVSFYGLLPEAQNLESNRELQ